MVMIRRGIDFIALTLIALHFLHGFAFGVPPGNRANEFPGWLLTETGRINPDYTNESGSKNAIVEFKTSSGIIRLRGEGM